jgi:hypothetical protein
MNVIDHVPGQYLQAEATPKIEHLIQDAVRPGSDVPRSTSIHGSYEGITVSMPEGVHLVLNSPLPVDLAFRPAWHIGELDKTYTGPNTTVLPGTEADEHILLQTRANLIRDLRGNLSEYVLAVTITLEPSLEAAVNDPQVKAYWPRPIELDSVSFRVTADVEPTHDAVVLPLPESPGSPGTTAFSRDQIARLIPDPRQSDNPREALRQMAALEHITAAPKIVDPDWKLSSALFLEGARAAHFNPHDGRVYVGRRLGDTIDGLYRLEADGKAAKLLNVRLLHGIAVNPENGDVFFNAQWGNSTRIWRVPVNTDHCESWLNLSEDGRRDLMGIEVAPPRFAGKVVASGQALVVERGIKDTAMVLCFSANKPDDWRCLHENAPGEGPLFDPVDVTLGPAGVFIADTGDTAQPGSIFHFEEDGSLTPIATSEPITDPFAVTTDPATGDLLVLDLGQQRLVRLRVNSGEVSDVLSGLSIYRDRTGGPCACLDITPDGRRIFITDNGSSLILILTRASPRTTDGSP